MYTTHTLTQKLCTVDCQPVIHAQSVCRRPRCLPSSRLLKLQRFSFFVVLEDLSKRQNRESEIKKNILILDRVVTFVNETYQIPLCTTMLILSTKPVHRVNTCFHFVFRLIMEHFKLLKVSLLVFKILYFPFEV